MKKGNALIGWFLILVALGFYLYGVYEAIAIAWEQKKNGENLVTVLPEGIDTILTSFNALLLTNLGIVLGISVTLPSSALSRNLIPRSSLHGAAGGEVRDPLNSREQVQLVCLIAFLLALCACFVTWLVKEVWQGKTIVAYVSQSAKTLAAVLVTYLSFVLGTRQGNG
jgi:hypothetical protein